VVICDEISTKEEVEAARTMGQRGVRIIASVCFFFVFVFFWWEMEVMHIMGQRGVRIVASVCSFYILFLLKCYYTDTEHCTVCRFRV